MRILNKEIKLHRRQKLFWGVAGLGRFAELRFLPALALLKKSRLLSVYSHDIQRARYIAGTFGAEEAHDNYSEFLKGDFDALYISSRNVDHYEQVLEAARSGKNILCEKPMAMNSHQAAQMCEICSQMGVMLALNYSYRYHPLVRKAKELIENDLIGKLVSISINYNMDYAPQENFRFRKALSGGGALFDIGTHCIDLLRFFGGEVSEVKGYTDNIVYRSEVDDFACGMLKFEKGGYGNFTSSFNAKKGFNRIEIIGYKGTVAIENLIGKRQAAARLSIDVEGQARMSFRKRESRVAFLRPVQDAFLTGKDRLASGHDGFVNMEIMEEIQRG